jgi:hypothetical protein
MRMRLHVCGNSSTKTLRIEPIRQVLFPSFPRFYALAHIFDGSHKMINNPMKPTVSKSLFITFVALASILSAIQVNAQLFPAGSVLLSNHSLSDYTISSTQDYVQLESSISTISAKLHDAFQNHPNLQYTPSLNDNEIIGFIVTGVNNSAEANEISYLLMQLEVLGDLARSADEKFLPVVNEIQSAHVSRKEARL